VLACSLHRGMQTRSNCWAHPIKRALYYPGLQGRSRKELEVFGWSRSRIPKNTRSLCRSRIFLSDSGSSIQLFFTTHS